MAMSSATTAGLMTLIVLTSGRGLTTITGSEQESVEAAVLRGFVKNDELGFKEQPFSAV
jgi:hypothetical protein